MCKCWAHVSFSHRALRLAQSNYFVNEFALSIAIRFRASHAVRVYVLVVHLSELAHSVHMYVHVMRVSKATSQKTFLFKTCS